MTGRRRSAVDAAGLVVQALRTMHDAIAIEEDVEALAVAAEMLRLVANGPLRAAHRAESRREEVLFAIG